MKSGFHTDLPMEKEPDVQRADQNIPLNKFGIAGFDLVINIYISVFLVHFK